MSRLLDDEEITRQLRDLAGWRVVEGHLVATYESSSFLEAVRLAEWVADEAEQMDHHPFIDIRMARTTWEIWTHWLNGITQLDIELAHRVQERARTTEARVIWGD
ncbi:4a-hydroxytetrahydrobiopterin dehydratase [Arsenicicoccus dermatophilus]|uniref:4a-hydroxytetrahydrobiopterin dehydratase n=1 Tax=Arsenicicoccus dermatophilus TaxID=1076331 RepID=UPI001F4D0086|nr:4a-hydroxytetrahydrobiopterin dehydratase [Arsenicicoccus dermatophilus]MCH8613691.1 4a-hydroxytetrahydrobiopterin dehydratase [Arsenicicoccus dermatophilus]